MIMSWTAPARQTPATSQMQPGREAELRREHGPDERARTGDRREVMAEQHPLVRRVEVVAVLQRVRRRDAPVVEHHHLRREERAVEAVRDREDAEGRNDTIYAACIGGILYHARCAAYDRPLEYSARSTCRST